jgi:integrase
MHTPDLFDPSARDWLQHPNAAFADWLLRMEFKHNYQIVLAAMWGKFVGWMEGHGLRLDTLEARHIAQFLDAAGLEKRIRAHYVRLIERVYTSVQSLPDFPAKGLNPASLAAKQGETLSAHNAPTRFLADAVFERVVHVIEGDPRSESVKAVKLTGKAGAWKVVRDRALLGVFAGAGLKLHEAVALTPNCISPDGWIHLPRRRLSEREKLLPAGDAPEIWPHSVPLENFAQQALTEWLTQRSALPIEGDMLFPATPKGAPMHPSTAFRRVQALLVGLEADEDGGERLCPQTLRNTFIALHFRRGTPLPELAEMVGIQELITLERLRFSYECWAVAANEAWDEMALA